MGSITIYSNGLPVTIQDRTYKFDETVRPEEAEAFKSGAAGDDVVELWRKQPALRMVTTFLADAIAAVPIHCYQREDSGERSRLAPDHVLSATFREPDAPRLTAYEWLRTLVLDVCLYDRYAAQVFLADDGRQQVVRMPPKSWKFERDSMDRPKSITVTRKDGSTFTVALDSALWLDGYPSDLDTSPVEALRGTLAEAEEAANYRRQLWRNAGRFPGWLSRPAGAQWGKDARERFRSSWQKYASAGDRAGHTPLLEDGMSYHEATTGITPETGQQVESRQLTIAEVAAAYQVPPQMVGIDSGSSYNSVEGYREALYQDTLGAWFSRLDGAFNMRMVPLLVDNPGEVYSEFAVAAKLRMAFEAQTRIFQTATGGPIMTRAEARARLNLPHIKGTDDLIVPMNVTVGGQASPTDSGSQNIGGNK